MKRLIGFLVFISILFAPVPASAVSDWDPDDVDGPLDIRWIGATFLPNDHFKLTVSFHNDFRASALPRRITFHHGVVVNLTDFMQGLFRHRRDGRIVFIYGDFASNCCYVARVARPSPNLLKVIDPTVHDPADLTYRIRATSTWYDDDNHHVRDHTGWLNLGAPPV